MTYVHAMHLTNFDYENCKNTSIQNTKDLLHNIYFIDRKDMFSIIELILEICCTFL